MKVERKSKAAAPLLAEICIPAKTVSRGIAYGRVICLYGRKRQFFRISLNRDQIENEINRFRSAVLHAIEDLKKLAAEGPKTIKNVSDVFDTHLAILNHSSYVKSVEAAVRNEKINADWAVKEVSETYLSRQRSAADKHIREKYIDILDVSERLLAALDNSAHTQNVEVSGRIIVAREIWPSTLVDLAEQKPLALITETGGWTSHTSILARSFGIPAVSGIDNVYRLFDDSETVLVDAMFGEVVLNPSKERLFNLTGNVEIEKPDLDELAAEVPLITLDRTPVHIRCNVDSSTDYSVAHRYGAQGIGLYRSDILFSNSRGFPSEMKQKDAYSDIARAAGKSGVKIRTFDIGSDQITNKTGHLERNPSLGLRSIRLSIRNQRYFRIQIRALLQASYCQNIDIMIPMVSGVDEILSTKSIIAEEREKLKKEKRRVGKPGLGAMIEVPSAVLTVAEIARHVDFLCLGTNDLVQYLLAADRDNVAVADWYQTLHPAVLRAILAVINGARAAGKPLIICGEIAGSTFYTPLLLGLGARELSINVKSIPAIRRLIAGIALDETKPLIDKILKLETAGEIELALRKHYRANWPHLFPREMLQFD